MVRRYDGQHAGSVLLPVLQSAKRKLFVCSPFISPEYARLLVSRARGGVAVYVLTSQAPENKIHQESLSILAGRSINQSASRRSFLLAGLGLLFLLLSLLNSSWVLVYVGAMFLALWFVYSRLPVRHAPQGLQLKISSSFIHAKIYAADDRVAVTGSPNLTFSGLNKNVEHVDVFEGREAVPVIESFRRLWNSASSFP